MYLVTNLKYNFSKFDDILTYMLEENISNVDIEINWYGVKMPKTNYTIEELKKHIEEVKELK